MSTFEKRLTLLQAVIGLVTVVASIGAGWAVMSYRVGVAESRIQSVETQQKNDHDILLDMRGDVKWLVNRLK